MKVTDSMFGFTIEVRQFNLTNKRPTPPQGYIEYNNHRVIKCPNCGETSPGRVYGGCRFQDRQVQNLMRAMERLSERDYEGWKCFPELFSVDLDPSQPKYSTMLKSHPSRYSLGKFYCCDAKIWHDFYDGDKSKYPSFGWRYYYKPTALNNNTLQAFF